MNCQNRRRADDRRGEPRRQCALQFELHDPAARLQAGVTAAVIEIRGYMSSSMTRMGNPKARMRRDNAALFQARLGPQ
jgi:hypothetical protein